MKNRYFSALAPLLGSLSRCIFSPTAALAQEPATVLLRDDAAPAPSALADALAYARPLTLDPAAARAWLATAPPENQPAAAPLVLALPLPDGGIGRFAVWQTAVMAPALAAQFPDIATYAGRGLDDATATVRLDLTPAGFHAQVLSAVTGTIYIDPARRDDDRHYLSFFGRDIRRSAAQTGSCGFVPTAKPNAAASAAQRQAAGPGGPAGIASGSVLRTYRLAVATTGEYAAFHGGTVPLVQAAIVTSINRVVGVYEKELAVRLVLVPNNNLLINLNASTDPYTNNNGGTLLDENQTNVDALIGDANYDIGHVFSTGGGGIAGYAVVCRSGEKAQGVTGSGSPVGDSFDIDYVAHEMGHQFSGSHPFNGSTGSCGGGNRSADRAWEPGSGSTIMAYAGICAPQNLQPNSDPFFHAGNYEEMRGFIVTTPCAVVTATTNTPPAISGPASGLVLPYGTPFKLTATAADADGDAFTYNWEELDLGTVGSPTATQTTNNNVPLFRSFVPSASPTRYFPRLTDLVANRIVIGERLPTVTRQLTFKCTARDQHRSPTGLIGGVSTSDSVKLTVTRLAGPFSVVSPNTALSWTGGVTYPITWSVAGTTANGVNCALVNVRLSTDGGLTYPTALALAVPNTGTANVVLPNVATTTARVLVEAADNYFFDISNANFTISSPSVCAPPTALAVSSITNTSATVSFVPAATAVRYVLTTTPPTTTQIITASPAVLTGLLPGTAYTVSLVADCGSSSTSVAATVGFISTAPPLCSAPSELAISNRTLVSATLNFVPSASAVSYTVSTVPTTTTQTVTTGPVSLTGLAPATFYVVRVVGNCAGGATAPPASLRFRTLSPPPANDLCANALPLACGIRRSGTTDGATTTGDPTQACGGLLVDGGGVFYTLVGNGGRTTVVTCGAATNFDSELFIYQGPCGGPYTCIAANDDGPGSCAPASSLVFATTLGATYLVFVSGYGGESGNFTLLATCAAPTATTAAAEATFRVSPNPAGGHAAFQVQLLTPAAVATATLHNVLGQRLLQRTFAGAATELPTTGLAPGTYLLTVQVAGQAPAVRRVVVE